MPGSVFSKSIRDLRGLILGWGIGLGVMTAVTILIYPSFQHLGELDGFVKSLPPAMQKMIGGQTGLSVPEEFLNIKLFDSWLPIILAVFSILQCAAAIAGEEENGTIDLLLANPVTRRRIVLEKFAATGVAVVAITVFIGAGIVFGILVTGLDASIGRLIWATVNMVPVALVFGAMGLVGSCVFHRRRPASGIAIVILIASYFVYALSPLTDAVRPWLTLSLFHYYRKTNPIGHDVELISLFLFAGLLLGLLAVAVAAFRRKDLNV
jgi:ABC-2 type transport system permease protein